MYDQDQDKLVDKPDLTSRIEFNRGSNRQAIDQNRKN